MKEKRALPFVKCTAIIALTFCLTSVGHMAWTYHLLTLTTAAVSDQRYTAQLEQFSDEQLLAADIDGDGAVGINDATLLQRFLAEFTVPYPIGQ